MALIQCPHYGNPSVSDRATHCPHYGKPVNRAASPTSSTPHGTLPPSHLPQRRKNVRYEFKLYSNENAPLALQTYYSGSLDITWSGGQKYRDVDLTIVSKE